MTSTSAATAAPLGRRSSAVRLRRGPTKTLSLCSILVAIATGSACSDAPRDAVRPTSVPFGIAAVTDLTTIAELRPPGVAAAQISSYDRTGGNADLGIGPDATQLLAPFGVTPQLLDNSYLYRDGERYVVFDERGPGVVTRLWMTGLDALFLGALGGDVAFELDDEPTPRLVLSREQLFSGTEPPFLAPLAGNAAVSSGGYYSMVPIPFARRLRITTSLAPHWLHIAYAHLPPDADVKSFDPSADTSAAAATLAAVGVDPKGIAADRDDVLPADVPAGARSVVWQHDGPGTVLSLELEAAHGTPLDIPTGLVLEATWDDAATPQVAAPLDDVFGASLGAGARALAFGRDGGRFYLYFPMPFRASARIALRNDAATAFAGWTVRVKSVDRVLGDRPGYFHATARSARVEPDGSDYALLERGGSGHVVGVVITAGCAAAGRCMLPATGPLDGAHLEGDERVRIDGSPWPQIHGTGLEDFFGGGFYFLRGAFTLPTHGNPAQEPTSSPRRPGINLRSAYRLLLADAIPFRNGIALAIEHGPTNDVPAEMSSLVFFYAIDEPTIVSSDAITIGDAASEAGHALTADGRADDVLTSAFRGDDSDEPFARHGFSATVTRFRVAIAPQNAGVRLRRVADVGAGRQSALVKVDGEPVGIWSSTDVNPALRFAVLDFELPAAVTRGKSALDVELDARASATPWTAFGYEAWSHVGG